MTVSKFKRAQSQTSFRHSKLDLVRDGMDRPIWNTANAVTIFSNHTDWGGAFGYDELAARHMLLRPLPDAPGAEVPRELSDADITHVVTWFNRNGFPRASRTVVEDAVRAVAEQNRYNECVDYLNGLAWDGIPRIHSWAARYLGAEDTDYVREVGKRWLISAVARALCPGCKADHMLVLEGDQGIGKSSVLRVLASPDWFADALPDMKGKDASSYLRGMWIVEIPELAAMRRADVEQVKAFTSRQEERYRPAFGRFEVREPRRCVFAGTTNRKDYVRDETGGRRFWPLPVTKIDLEALARDRDQLWAEAVHAYRRGEIWWLTGEVEEQARAEQAERQEDDPWLAPVSEFVADKAEVACKEILGEKLQLQPYQMERKHSTRVASLLQRLGFVRDGKFTSGSYKDLARYVRRPP